MKTVNVKITPDGDVRVEAVGFKGKACEKFTAALEQALGKVKGHGKKPEYYQQEMLQH